MQSLAIRAGANAGFRLTLDLSAWAAVGVELAAATLRLQARVQIEPPSTPALELVTSGPNPVVFDPTTGLVTFSAPGTAMAELAGVYNLDCRAEFSGYELLLFAGTLTVRAGVTATSPSSGLPSVDTAFVSAHPFGPAPVPAPISGAVASAQVAAQQALVRSMIYAAL